MNDFYRARDDFLRWSEEVSSSRERPEEPCPCPKCSPHLHPWVNDERPGPGADQECPGCESCQPPPPPREIHPDDLPYVSPRERLEDEAWEMDLEELEEEIDEGWRRISDLREVDAMFGTYSRERYQIMNWVVPYTVVLEKRKQRLKRQRMTGLAEVDYEEEPGSFPGVMVPCVYARCVVGDVEVGPVWGDGERSVRRALATLTEECTCGAAFHKEKED